MLLTLVITLLLIWAAVVGSLYSNFLTFYDNFAETENYNKAYYAAIAALERSELVVRQRDPWYVWTWWWISYLENWDTKRTNIGTSASDWLLSWFSYLTSWNSQWTNILWTINSRTKRIPSTWNWNVDWTLSAWDSLDYNKMDYENAEIFLLFYDNSSGNPYSWGTIQKSNLTWITWKIRLPQKLYGWEVNFWPLDTSTSIVAGRDQVKDDAIVDRQLRWLYNTTTPFTIYSTQDISNGSVKSHDTVIRESIINNDVNLSFRNKTSPISNKDYDFTVISSEESFIKTGHFYDSPVRVNSIFNNASFTKLQLRLALLNILWTNWKMIYPYLEYYLDFWWTEVADKYYTMNAEWKYWDYQVNLIVQKPTIKESILWSFTTIF